MADHPPDGFRPPTLPPLIALPTAHHNVIHLKSLSSTEFRDRLAELCHSDPEVTVLSYMLGPERLLEWAHSIGVARDSRLRECVPPVPPVELRAITAASDEALFLWTGFTDIANLLSIYARVRQQRGDRPDRVLDFGCGCGRMARFLNSFEGIEAFGVDINPDHVAWCQSNLTNIDTLLAKGGQPMPFADESFDLVYAMSVFTHLPEDASRRWLEEIARVIAPGGVLIATTHGYTALDVIRTSQVHQQMFGIDEESTVALIDRLGDEGFIFLPLAPELLALAKAGPHYGNSFIEPTYVTAHWSNAEFKVSEHLSAGLRGWQDIVVLERR